MNIDQLNSFNNFIDDSTLSIENKIKRELWNYITTAIGSGLFKRGTGSAVYTLENDGNSIIADALIKTKIVETVGRYNVSAPAELRAIVGSDMIAIKRVDNVIEIFVVFLPFQKPEVSSLSSILLSLPSFGG